MKRLICIAFLLFALSNVKGQVMMLFSSDSLTGITSPLGIDSLFYWFAADQGVLDSLGGAIATDEGVGTWQDLSGNGRHVTQATNTDRPVYKATGGPGSKPCIQFDGSDDFLASAAHFWGSGDITVIVVMKFANATRNALDCLISKYHDAGSSRQWIFFGNASAAFYRINFNTSPTGTATSQAAWYSNTNTKHTNYRVHSFVSDASDGNMFVDGGEITATNDAVTTIYNASKKLGVGVYEVDGTPAGFLQGSISEIIVYSKALSATERAVIENYLNKKYDLY